MEPQMEDARAALRQCRLAVIGAGVMGTAMMRAYLDGGLTTAEQVIASDPLTGRLEEVSQKLGVGTTTDNVEAVSQSDIIILSVKPQTLKKVLSGLQGHVPAEALVLSIVAGARLKTLVTGLGGHLAVVRVMPNTPAQIGKGMAVWTTTSDVSDRQRAWAQTLLAAMGEELQVDEESYLDMATALSGTGPAYVFLFMEALIDAGVHMGFSRQQSAQLVMQTLEGSVAMARHTGQHPAALRNAVTSPGGTTAEALYQLEKGGIRTVVSRAVWAAYQRSQALGGQSEE